MASRPNIAVHKVAGVKTYHPGLTPISERLLSVQFVVELGYHPSR
jgi:hypothetical protein